MCGRGGEKIREEEGDGGEGEGRRGKGRGGKGGEPTTNINFSHLILSTTLKESCAQLIAVLMY